MPLTPIIDRLNKFGISARSEKKKIIVEFEDSEKTIEVDEDWMKEIKHFTRAKQYTFDTNSRTLQANSTIEFGLRVLNRMAFRRPNYEFKSEGSDELTIGAASKRWMLGFLLQSDEFERYAELALKPRIKRDIKRTDPLQFDFLTWGPTVAKFKTRRKFGSDELLSYATSKAESCFLKLAIDNDECFDFSKYSEKQKLNSYEGESESTFSMPLASYSPPLAKFYKVAKSSQFPSQAFLSFYHVLEYQFYRISDYRLHTKIRSQISDTQFCASDDCIRKLLSSVYRHKQNLDEKELLKMVLEHYVEEEDFIEFIKELKADTGRDYSKKHDVFGESHFINPTEGHALSNGARVIKHIRNYLVHSSDKNTRDDRHVPLTEDDNLVLEYIPIVKYLAEKVIYGAAEEK